MPRISSKPRRESEIQRAILALKIPGLTLWKSGAGAFRVNGRFVRMGHKGVADLIGYYTVWCNDGANKPTRPFAQIVAVEVKRLGKKPTPEQMAFLRNVKLAGGLAIVATSTQDVIDALSGLEQ